MQLPYPLNLILDIAWGIKCRYPLCCIVNYIYDSYVRFYSPYLERMKRYNIKELDYVPCIIHAKYIHKCKRNKPLAHLSNIDLLDDNRLERL